MYTITAGTPQNDNNDDDDDDDDDDDGDDDHHHRHRHHEIGNIKENLYTINSKRVHSLKGML